MTIGYVFDEIFLAHQAPGPVWHPECPERLTAVLDALESGGLTSRMSRVAAREATREELVAVHNAAYVDQLERLLARSAGYIDPDTYFNESTRDAAWRAAGASAELATRVARAELDAGIALVRPPGHHATRERSMGFCLLNNVAVAARALQAAGLAQRIAILDWDVHHGNGTEDIFWDDPDVLYVSIHESPCYPGTGPVTASGGPKAPGTNVNVPLPPGMGDAEYLAVFDRVIAPAWRWFAPDFMLVSAGYDAWMRDPLAEMKVSRAGFASLAQRAFDLAGRSRFAAVLEGGYDRLALADMVTDLARILLGDAVPGVHHDEPPHPACTEAIDFALHMHAARWAAPK